VNEVEWFVGLLDVSVGKHLLLVSCFVLKQLLV